MLLYVWRVVAGTDTILHALNQRPQLAVRQYSVSVNVFQVMAVVVGILAALTIAVRAATG